MITAADAYELHEEACDMTDGTGMLADLLTKIHESIGADPDEDDALIISYGAVLLNLNQDKRALDWLLAHPLGYREYHLNLATAYGKLEPVDAKSIARNNEESARQPCCPDAIIAHMEY